MEPMTRYAVALVITVVVETALACLIRRDQIQRLRIDVPLMISSWGMTETSPACLIVHELIETSGIIGVPMTGLEKES